MLLLGPYPVIFISLLTFLAIRDPLHHSITCFFLLSSFHFFSSEAPSYIWPLSVLVFHFQLTGFVFTCVYSYPLSCFVLINVEISSPMSYFFVHVLALYANSSTSCHLSWLHVFTAIYPPENHSSRRAFVLLLPLKLLPAPVSDAEGC